MKMVKRIQKGFSLITAIFLLVVLTALGALMTTFFAVQQQSSAIDVLGSHAYQAARTGVEWAASNAPVWSDCPAISSPLFSANTLGGELSPFTVTVACSSASAVEGTSAVWVYSITASASGVNNVAPGSTDYVERVVQANIWTQGASQVVIWK